MNERPAPWQSVALGDVLTRLTYGFTNPMPTTDDGPYMVTAKDVRAGRIDYASARHTSREAFLGKLTDKSRPNVGDVLLTKDGSIGRVALVDRSDICINQSVALLQPNKMIDSRFLSYLLQAPYYQDRMAADADGSTIKHIYITRVDKMQIMLPPLAEQIAIAATLSALDDKIDSNRRLQRTSEALVRAMYVELREGSADADLCQLGDIATSERTQAAPQQLTPSDSYIGLEHMPRGSLFLDQWAAAGGLGSAKLRFIEGDVLFGKLRPYFKKVGLAPCDGVCSTDILVVRPRQLVYRAVVVCACSDDAMIESVSAAATGTRMPRASWADLAAWPVPSPDTPRARHFAAKANALLDRALALTSESLQLQEIRDTLLVELISGHIRVPDAEAAREAS